MTSTQEMTREEISESSETNVPTTHIYNIQSKKVAKTHTHVLMMQMSVRRGIKNSETKERDEL